MPIALISFVDKDRQWFKSHRGLPVSETSREYSFCAHALNAPEEIMIIQDSRTDDRFKNNPLVTGDPNIVFYAGFPLVNKAGYGLGTVCVIDREKRTLDEDQVKAIQSLSKQVMNLLELGKAKHELETTKHKLEAQNALLDQFAMVVAHDIKSPLATVLSANEMLNDIYKKKGDEDTIQLLSASTVSAKKIKSLVDGILAYYKEGSSEDAYEEINLPQFFEGFKQTILLPKPWKLHCNLENETIRFNKVQLEQIFFNLISNGIRYNNSQMAEISIDSKETHHFYHFAVSDNGIGIKKENHEAIFNLFATLSAKDTFNVKGSGIGLPTVKKIIGISGGAIAVNSEEGKGTTFSFTLKK